MLRSSDLYRRMHRVTKFADDYYLDAVIGLIPGGIGDIIGGLFSLMHVYFGLIKLRSIPLTLALLNNMLRDILLGLLPFYVGDVIDFLHKANKKNMALIDGFLNDDPIIMHQVNTKARQAAFTLVLLMLLIILLVALLAWMVAKLGSLLFT